MRATIAAIVLCLGAWTSAAQAAPCGPGDPAGLYEGAARSADGTSLDVSLNLRCEAGRYRARFFTSAGDFDGVEPTFAGGRMTVKFDNGAALGSASLAPDGMKLSGGFDIAGDKGTMSLVRTGEALADGAWTPRLDLTAAQWRADLAALARDLPLKHANAFAFLPRARFEAKVADLDRRIPAMNGDQIFVALAQLINAIGDGHTGIVAPPDRENLPIALTAFGADLRVTAAGPGLDRMIGARVLRIGDMPTRRAHALALTLTPTQELPELREGRVAFYLARGLTLHGLGIAPQRSRAVFTLGDDAGAVFTQEVRGLGSIAEVAMKSARAEGGLRAERPDDPFWCKALADGKTLYCAWRGYQDLHAKARAMWTLIETTRPKRLVIDLRDNGGGDNTVGDAELVQPIRARADLNRKGRLYVLVGPLTFSAAMNNAAQFQDQTNAVLAGQTIGERPNSYQEPRQFRLPNSHLIVRASTRYYAFRKTGENAVRPRREIIPTWRDVKAGRDPVLDWVIAQPVD